MSPRKKIPTWVKLEKKRPKETYTLGITLHIPATGNTANAMRLAGTVLRFVKLSVNKEAVIVTASTRRGDLVESLPVEEIPVIEM